MKHAPTSRSLIKAMHLLLPSSFGFTDFAHCFLSGVFYSFLLFVIKSFVSVRSAVL